MPEASLAFLYDSAGHQFRLLGAQIEEAFNVQHPTAGEQLATIHPDSTTFTVMPH